MDNFIIKMDIRGFVRFSGEIVKELKLDKVDESLSAVGGTPFSDNGEWEYWSSTESYICDAWFLDSFGKLNNKDYSYNGNKDDRRFVRAVRNF